MSVIELHRKPTTLKAAQAIAGSLGSPSKMPGRSYGISAHGCITGAKLAKVAGSVCHGCYALRANYAYPSVMAAHAKRAAGIGSPVWADAMILQIAKSGDKFFRWHDSGDLQSLGHLLAIVRVAEALPDVSFWLPTREKAIVRLFQRAIGEFPRNLCVRVSAAMVDGAAPAGFANTSTVFDKAAPAGHECPARHQSNRCGDCRACWDRNVANVAYHVH